MDKFKKTPLFIDTIFSKTSNQYLFFTVISFAIFLCSYNFGMFWDNVLFTSKIGNHLYNTSIFNWMLPDNLDAGHPPTLGFLLAIFWKIFGHHLWVAHLLMIPFTIGFFYQLFQLIYYFTKSYSQTLFAFLLIIVDPTLSTQFVLVNPEIIQLFLFFLAINSILKKQNTLKIIALFFLSIISLRSMMLCSGVFLFEIINQFYIHKKRTSIINKKLIFSYILGTLPAILYLTTHYIYKGWLYSHANSPWAGNHGLISFSGFLRNCAILVHKYLDFGRVFIIVFLLLSFIVFGKKIIKNQKNKQLILLAITSNITVIVASLLSTNPFGHRYFIVSYICLALLAFLVLKSFYIRKKIIYCVLILGLLTGNLWIYPKEIAQGWDATLAHLPYYNLRLKAINYLNENDISVDKVASFFPNITAVSNVDFSDDNRAFINFNTKNKYVFYSNVYNLTDKEYEEIDKNYTLLKDFNKHNITIKILIRK